MDFNLKSSEREEVFKETGAYIEGLGLRVIDKDFERPWGGFFVIDETQAQQFGEQFFPDTEIASLRIAGKLSPKILVVGPGKRLSWQYHFRRAEIWRAISGTVGVITSLTDTESDDLILSAGQGVRLAQGERHRLVGLSGWGVVAEIWQHTDAGNPSDEDDIVRLQDDFGR